MRPLLACGGPGRVLLLLLLALSGPAALSRAVLTTWLPVSFVLVRLGSSAACKAAREPVVNHGHVSVGRGHVSVGLLRVLENSS